MLDVKILKRTFVPIEYGKATSCYSSFSAEDTGDDRFMAWQQPGTTRLFLPLLYVVVLSIRRRHLCAVRPSAMSCAPRK